MGTNRFGVTASHIVRNDKSVIPVTGELHYGRVPRDKWETRLRALRAGGVTTVASYVFWSHHQPSEDVSRFTAQWNLASFIRTAQDADLDVVLRIGPWCHGEARNGGFPDWVQASKVLHRTNDPLYLGMVDRWFSALGDHLRGVIRSSNRLVAIQVENELYDQPAHIATLREMAERHGLTAPVWTATAWGGAQLPDRLVMPLYGGYADGFWVSYDDGWDDTFREHFFHSHTWDDSGIGADLRDTPVKNTNITPGVVFPAATCELGGGMATAYHRRPILDGRDIAAVAHTKIGNGSAWQGYYIFAGGTNPADGRDWQESHATGYPNDLPRFDYDFQAPIGAAGELRDSYGLLREQHTFLRDFGDQLSAMSSTLPEVTPRNVRDTCTLRWALRSDGETGIVFITWHQPFERLPDVGEVQFYITLDQKRVTFPQRPVTIPAGTIARWPVSLTINQVLLEWASASLIGLVSGDVPLLVVGVEPGIEAHLLFEANVTVDRHPVPATDGEWLGCDLLTARTDTGSVDVLIVPPQLRSRLTITNSGRIVFADGAVSESEGALLIEESSQQQPGEFLPHTRIIEPTGVVLQAGQSHPITTTPFKTAVARSSGYGTFEGRESAPQQQHYVDHAARWRLELPHLGTGDRLEVSWIGDTAVLMVDGQPVRDQFYNTRKWLISLDDLALTPDSSVEIWILPMPENTHIAIGIGAPIPTAGRADILEVKIRAPQAWVELAHLPQNDELAEAHQ